jgi:hypothetical protein
MKKVLFLLLTSFIVNSSFSQILNPVKFDYSVVKKGKDTYEVHIKTTLDPKWHIYSVKNPDGGADATTIKLTSGTPIGAVKEIGTLKAYYDKNFKVDQKYFESKVDFVQVVKLKPGIKLITGTIEYMVCNDSRCLPPKEVEFKIKI